MISTRPKMYSKFIEWRFTNASYHSLLARTPRTGENVHTKFDWENVSRTASGLRERVSPAQKRSSYSFADRNHWSGGHPRASALLAGPSWCRILTLVYLGPAIDWIDIGSSQIQDAGAPLQPKNGAGNSNKHAGATRRRTSAKHQTSAGILVRLMV